MSGGAPDPNVAMGSMALLVIGGAVVGIVVAIMGAALASAIHAGVSGGAGANIEETFN